MGDFDNFPSPVHTFGETLLFLYVNIVGDVGGGKASLDTDIGEVFEEVDLLHLVGGEDGLTLFFVAEHRFV